MVFNSIVRSFVAKAMQMRTIPLAEILHAVQKKGF